MALGSVGELYGVLNVPQKQARVRLFINESICRSSSSDMACNSFLYVF